ncbi:hypothetical protein L1787_00205 [Acuticoccus sp. M5D2P5]|uniref:hypothetical protein n=1 Tax=Acuticoccus kalidii TaxID=2910977 RepID=UPI001F1ED4F7|nr:hypothetical protein [Acuticoccus kalidii]MCF3931832.1 hypothetical protein [Acuticoccus kalidii]
MKNAILREIGEALYGASWRAPLARDLDVSERTVRRWVAGEGVPNGVSADLLRLTQERADLLDELAHRLKHAEGEVADGEGKAHTPVA